jgi:hypothetical protein
MIRNDDLNQEARDLNEMQAQDEALVARWVRDLGFKGDVARGVAKQGWMSDKQRKVLGGTNPQRPRTTDMEWHQWDEELDGGYDDDIPF